MSSCAPSSGNLLLDASRLRPQLSTIVGQRALEVSILLAAGALGVAAVAWLPLPLRIPGHAILKGALLIVIGIAAAPRPAAGLTAGLGAMAAVLGFSVLGVAHLQAAAMTAILAIGPAIDLAMFGLSRRPSSIYLRFAAAGLAANLFAFAIRWGMSATGVDAVQPHRMEQIGLGALASFALCGVAAGLMSAVVAFRNSPSGSVRR